MSTPQPPVNHLPTPSAAPLFRAAKQLAEEAVMLDKQREYRAAVHKYTRAVEALRDFLRVNKNPRLQQQCAAKVEEYVARAKFLLFSVPNAGGPG